ncbi:MAG: hypothetical protein ACJ8AT_35455 [Hyalangium sp.]|uniref:hypothetical protein n=1 Tax=Hyalangium sp. TaxID=2028555 RepID=UPI003899B202
MKRFRSGYAAVCAAALGLSAAAQAHEFICDKTVGGSHLYEITKYPVTLSYRFTVINSHPTDTSVAQSVEDPLLVPYGFHFTPAPPFSVPVGQSVSDHFDLTVKNEAECLALAAADGTVDRYIDNTFIVSWESGSAVCSARAVCGSHGGGQPPPECQPGRGAKRGLGFWKTHVKAAQACLSAGPIDVGIATVRTMADIEGILWGSPARFANGAKRGDLDQKRFLLARELLVATCNVRVLGAEPSSPDLFSNALAVLDGTDCGAISSYVVKLDLPKGCENDSINTGQMFGKADPKLAQSLAVDPSSPSGETCSSGGNGHGGGNGNGHGNGHGGN